MSKSPKHSRTTLFPRYCLCFHAGLPIWMCKNNTELNSFKICRVLNLDLFLFIFLTSKQWISINLFQKLPSVSPKNKTNQYIFKCLPCYTVKTPFFVFLNVVKRKKLIPDSHEKVGLCKHIMWSEVNVKKKASPVDWISTKIIALSRKMAYLLFQLQVWDSFFFASFKVL